jgi:membrane peptidoglycan carboxypeptidase
MGSPVKVYYDPAHPAFGILQPGQNGEMQLLYEMDLWFMGMFGLLLVATWLWYDDQRGDGKFSTPPVDCR